MIQRVMTGYLDTNFGHERSRPTEQSDLGSARAWCGLLELEDDSGGNVCGRKH